MEAKDFMHSFDGQVWAKAFVEAVRKNPAIATDEATMLGWFANAIMAGYDHARRLVQDPTSQTPEETAFWQRAEEGCDD